MKVILIKDIENLGKKYEIKEIADGYVRNFLLPNNLVKIATKKAVKELEKQKETEVEKAEEELKEIQQIVSKIDGQEIEIPVKIKESGELYGSVTIPKIIQVLKDKGFKIKKSQIKFKEPIKKIGEHSLIISFDHGLEAEIKVIIKQEKEESEKLKSE